MIKQLLHRWLCKYIKNAPFHTGRGVLAKLAWKLYPQEFIHEVVPGVKIKVRLNENDDVRYYCGRFEEHGELQAFLSLLQEGMTVIDIGANIGMYSMLCSRVVGSTGKVIAFEPVPDVYQRLKDHLDTSQISNVYPYQIALSDSNGKATFYLGRNHCQGSLYRKLISDVIEVIMETLDHFVQVNGISRIDAIKVDAEGAEMHILRGMHQLLSQSHKPILLFEHNYTALAAAGSSANELFNSILQYNYTAYRIRKGKLHRVTEVFQPRFVRKEAYTNYIFLPSSSTGNAN